MYETTSGDRPHWQGCSNLIGDQCSLILQFAIRSILERPSFVQWVNSKLRKRITESKILEELAVAHINFNIQTMRVLLNATL